MKKQIKYIILLLIVLYPALSFGEPIYVMDGFENKQISNNIAKIAEVYGVDRIVVKNIKKVEVQKDMPVALVASLDAINKLGPNEHAALLKKIQAGVLNLLIVCDSTGKISMPATESIHAAKINLHQGTLIFSGKKEHLRELSGVRLDVAFKDDVVMLTQTHAIKQGWEKVSWAATSSSKEEYLWILRRKYGIGWVYLAGSVNVELSKSDELFRYVPAVLPFVMFINNTYGERIWHRKSNQANLTFDDPWLREPYGNLSYKALLNEMDKANFHTTIAFVPWNYDRSEKAVVELFLKNRKRYSVCIHGNNHDINEFHQYDKHSLNNQEADIRQALARMEKFKEITGIDYCKVMIFPRGIAPADTIGLLGKYNFLSSVNSMISPLGREIEYSIDDMVLPASLRYYNVPLLKRYPPNVDRNIIALMMYFKKPVLLYTHQGFLADGIDAFNGVAQYVNEVSPGIEWTDLGRITEGLYLEKRRRDGAYDIWILSRRIVIRNDSKRAKKIVLSKVLADIDKVEVLIIGKTSHSDKLKMEFMRTRVIEPGETLRVEFIFKDLVSDPQRNQKIEESAFGVKLVRLLSDFRDIYVSRSKAGRTLIDWYYKIFSNSNGY